MPTGRRRKLKTEEYGVEMKEASDRLLDRIQVELVYTSKRIPE
jgi:hypothetical protein